MKKFTLLIIAITLFCNTINAQEEGIRVGLKAGGNYANVYDSKGDEFTSDAKLGVVAGGFLDISLGRFLAIQPEILFSQKGFKGTGKVLGSAYSLTRTSNFLDIPLLLALKPFESVRVLIGPQFSYLLKQKDVFGSGALTFEQEKVFNNDNIRKNILCIVGGVDVNIKYFVIGARAGWDLQNNNGDGTTATPRYKNAWAQATLGFRIL